MLREIAAALREIGERRVLVLALEDLQLSDPSSLTLIALLARQSENARLLTIGTHRPAAALPVSHPLQALLRELAGRNCEIIALEGLTPAQVEEDLSECIRLSSVDLSRFIRSSARFISAQRAILYL